MNGKEIVQTLTLNFGLMKWNKLLMKAKMKINLLTILMNLFKTDSNIFLIGKGMEYFAWKYKILWNILVI